MITEIVKLGGSGFYSSVYAIVDMISCPHFACQSWLLNLLHKHLPSPDHSHNSELSVSPVD